MHVAEVVSTSFERLAVDRSVSHKRSSGRVYALHSEVDVHSIRSLNFTSREPVLKVPAVHTGSVLAGHFVHMYHTDVELTRTENHCVL